MYERADIFYAKYAYDTSCKCWASIDAIGILLPFSRVEVTATGWMIPWEFLFWVVCLDALVVVVYEVVYGWVRGLWGDELGMG